ncbi:succinate dehydrogenase, cytochrome b556 subunit [Marinomonas epiphytica]
MNKDRPVNLDLQTIKLPITAVASILHRISAVIIWVGLGIFLTSAYFSLDSEAGFECVLAFFSSHFLGQFISWGLLTALGYYVCATIKHIIQDFGHFEELESGKQISTAVIVCAAILCILSGGWVWL